MKYCLATFITLGSWNFANACDFCTPTVVLTEDRAACFREASNERRKKLESNGRGFVRIDLDSCEMGKYSSNKNVVAGGNVPLPKDSRFLYLDIILLDCLVQIVDHEQGSFDPSREIIFNQICN